MQIDDPKKKRIFFSFHENSGKSLDIVNQLKDFFESWGIDCVVIAQSETTLPPTEAIYKGLESSDYLLQVYTDRPGPSMWMKFEWDTAETLRNTGKRRMHSPIMLFTGDTNLDDPSFADIKNMRDKGILKVVQIDKEGPARDLLLGILIKTGMLNKKHGEIILPDYCLKKAAPISLEALEGFIRNFRGAHENGLECVFPNREAAQERLNTSFSSASGTIRMIGFTLKRFVHPRHSSVLGKLFMQCIEKGVEAQLLLIDLECEAAKERAKIESPDKSYEESLLYTEGKEVREYWLGKHRCKERVKILGYKTPYVGLILFDNEAYVELYHLGKDIADPNLCGHVPILIIRKDSSLYNLFASHFENVWKEALDSRKDGTR